MPKQVHYKQKFREEWLKSESFEKWLVAVRGNTSIAHCKLCKCNINAKYSDLIVHMKAKKHIRANCSPRTIEEKEISLNYTQNLQSTKLEQNKDDDTCDIRTLVLESPGSYEEADIIPEAVEEKAKRKIRWSQYEKKYKTTWETDPKLTGWMLPDPSDAGKVHCKYCSCVLRAHKTDLYKHCGTSKHTRNSPEFLNLNDTGDPSKKIIVVSKPKIIAKRKVKTEKVVTPDGSFIILQSEQDVGIPERETNIYVDYSDTEPMEETIESESTARSDPEQEINDIATRIGYVLINDIERILRTQKNVLKFFKDNGEQTFSDSNLRKMTRICVGHLSQKYLVESALESTRMNSPTSEEKTRLTSRFRAIEEKLETTMNEMKNLKMSFEGVSELLPFTPINLGDYICQPSSSQHG